MCGIDLCPCLDYREYFGGCEVSESEVVGGREGDYVAFSCNGVGTEKEV